MRREEPRPKDRRKVSIPAELRDSLREVYELIREAKNDPDINLDFDDAIQVGPLCGGRCGKKPRPYMLTYFPTGDPDRGRWELTLHRTDIEDIGDGRQTEITMYCCTSPECRRKFREANATCFYCDYFEDPHFGTFNFPEAAAKLAERGINGLSEASSRDEVVAALGPPEVSGGGTITAGLGYVWPWIKYRRADCQIHFEFSKESTRTRMVTFLDKD